MPESTLAIERAEILAQCAHLAHGVRSVGRLTQDDRDSLNAAISSGLRSFYYPIVDGGLQHDWSFLYPGFELAIEADVADYDLPSDWGGIRGHVSFSNSDNAAGYVRKVSTTIIDQHRAYPSETSGQPEMYCERPRTSSGGTPQVWQLCVWPTPDDGYTLIGTYRVHPNALTEAQGVPYGGAEHSEAILQACLAAVELNILRTPGVHTATFRERLAASVAFDRGSHTPDILGYNGDRSSQRFSRGPRDPVLVATVGGELYEE